MSVTEAAETLRLSRMTILRRLKSESWPGGRTGRKYLLNRAFVVALAAEFGSGRNVVAEDFAAAWMARGTPEAAA
jgi:excisionase family DNA binding protein